jgi:conjugative relaxase-like TrwC/TraI family protein
MGADSVAYHQETVAEHGDDHPGRALAYYGSRGETPLRWGGALAAELGLDGVVTDVQYQTAYGPGGFRHPGTGEQLTATKRPGFELVIGPHKSVATLGVIGRADDMHALCDTETTATMDWLEGWFQARGGSRGRTQVRTQTAGFVYAVTRHATSRDGDPHPHDHVLVANVTRMGDDRGGFKALDSAALRDTTEAATMVGRLHAAAHAVRLGYRIETDDGASGRARRWRIAGVPDEVCELFSKRADEIADYLAEQGYTSYRARNTAARATRAVKRHTGADELLPRWHAELEHAGWPAERLAAALDAARRQAAGFEPAWTAAQVDALASDLMDPEGEFMRNRKVFTRSTLTAEVAPLLYGHQPAELDVVLDRIVRSELVVPLIPTGPTRETVYASAAVLANEHAIADAVERLIERPGPQLAARDVAAAVRAKEAELGYPLTAGQRRAVEAICASGRAGDVIVGIAGSGKTTALDAATTALEDAGYTVLGTATSGQAARTLGREANIEARTMRSLLTRLDHGRAVLDDRTVVILDEAGMTADADLARLVAAIDRAGAKLVLVGDHRQLSAVGPGGALAAMLDRHPAAVTALTENLRQRDPAERAALDQLRHGSVPRALTFYATRGRITVEANRLMALAGMVTDWAADTADGHDTIMVAYTRANVADLNRLARAEAHDRGRLTGPDLIATGGRPYATGDPVVLLAPNPCHGLVTSQRATVTTVDHDTQALTLLTDDNRHVTLTGGHIDAEHLDHGYAITVHREQGATCDRTHYLADGGGRELAYVALSRARHRTTIHAIADDHDQALDDLTYHWSNEAHQRWVIADHDIDTTTAEAGVETDHLDVALHQLAEVNRTLDRLDRLQQSTYEPPEPGYEPPAPDAELGL